MDLTGSDLKGRRMRPLLPLLLFLIAAIPPCSPFKGWHRRSLLHHGPRAAPAPAPAPASATVSVAAAAAGAPAADTADEPVVLTTLHANKYLEIKLNRPRKFNSLDTEMLTLIRDALDEHGSSGELEGVVLSAAEGKAFCAGGDIKHVDGLPDAAARVEFLHLEYLVHQRLFELSRVGPKPVPVIAVGDGIVMGAGAGLFMAASVRVVTENSLFAMPETKIGLMPDAGALYFLNRNCPAPIGVSATQRA